MCQEQWSLQKAEELYEEGKNRHIMETLNKLVFVEPDNQVAKVLSADVYQHIGHQKESPIIRKNFLTGAF